MLFPKSNIFYYLFIYLFFLNMPRSMASNCRPHFPIGITCYVFLLIKVVYLLNLSFSKRLFVDYGGKAQPVKLKACLI